MSAVGVLGGMGPAATLDFLAKLYRATPAHADQEHIPTFVINDPRVPDRSRAIEGVGETPLPYLLDSVARLEHLGSQLIVMPCNTAHYWHDDLQAAASVPFLSIVDATIADVRRTAMPGAIVAVLATNGTVQAGFYQARLQQNGFVPFVPPASVQVDMIQRAIHLVKAGDEPAGRALLNDAVAELKMAGCTHAILGCTEISLVFGETREWDGLTLIDSNMALANATVAWMAARS